jgi:surface protein/YD repeat-containing protein
METAKKAMAATTEAERVNAELKGNVLTVTDRTGEVKTLDLMDQEEASNTKADIARIKESMGIYSDKPNITLTAKENNVAISADGVKVSKQGWAIAEFTAELGNIYLFNPGETSSDVCVFAEFIDKVQTRAIDYAYMYDESGRVLTAKATYNGKTYTYTYDYSSSITTITDQDGNNVSSLPSVYTTKVGAYNPMTILNTDAELPQDGYCRFVSNFTTASAIKIVVCYKVSSADLTMKVVRDGSTANMCSQLAKINKKVDEVSAKIPDMWMDICSIQPMGVNVNGKTYILEAGKNYRFEDVFSLDFQVDGYYHLRNVKRLNFHFNKMNCPLTTLKLFANKRLVENGMKHLQHGCESLTELDVSGFDTSRSISLDFAFSLCWNLKKLDVASWDTSNVLSMRNTFFYTKAEAINVECWDTSKVMSMDSMFGHSRVENLDLSRWNTEKVTNMNSLFNFCSYLKKLDVSSFNTAKVTLMKGVFWNCSSLEALDLSKWDTSMATSLVNFLGYNSKLSTLTFGENFGKMKDECGTLDLSNLSQWKNDSVKTLLTLYDRKSNGMGVITIKLHANAKAILGEDGIAQLTAKGYTIA